MQMAGFRGGPRHDAVDVRHACKRRTGDYLGLVIGGFALFNLAMNARPNATTFTLAPTLFPTSIRGSDPPCVRPMLSNAGLSARAKIGKRNFDTSLAGPP